MTLKEEEKKKIINIDKILTDPEVQRRLFTNPWPLVGRSLCDEVLNKNIDKKEDEKI